MVVAPATVVVVVLVVLEDTDVDGGTVGEVVVVDAGEEHAAKSNESPRSKVIDGRGRMEEG